MALFGRESRSERRGPQSNFSIVGLGNPGKEYARTRHNVGEEAVALLAQRCGATLKAGRDKAIDRRGHRCATNAAYWRFRLTYMNESGQAVGALARRFAMTDPSQIDCRSRRTRSEPAVRAGQGRWRSRRATTGCAASPNISRPRTTCGSGSAIGKPPSKEHGANHVLSKLPKAEREALDVAVQIAADAVEDRGVQTGRRGDARLQLPSNFSEVVHQRTVPVRCASRS